MNEKNLKTKIAVILNARNEEQFIEKTLKTILNQKIPPYRIIVINDGSIDSTAQIVSGFQNIELINKPIRHESHLAKKELAETINLGLKKLHNDKNCEYVWLSGGDIIFPPDYTLKIIEKMKSNPSLVIASGIVKGEFSIEPRGGGRIVQCDFWRKIGMLYPINYGWEGYLIWKAQSMGYETKSFSDIVTYAQRTTGTLFNAKIYYYYGLALKALGYTFLYTLAKSLLFARKKPKAAYQMLKGYLSDYDELYEPELRNYIRKTQSENIFSLKYIRRFFRILSN